MGGMSIWHWLILLPIFIGMILVIAVPIGRILGRAGFSPWWAIVYFVPLLGLAALWVFAFSAWPALDRRQDAGSPQA
jgi:hypothetical protein